MLKIAIFCSACNWLVTVLVSKLLRSLFVRLENYDDLQSGLSCSSVGWIPKTMGDMNLVFNKILAFCFSTLVSRWISSLMTVSLSSIYLRSSNISLMQISPSLLVSSKWKQKPNCSTFDQDSIVFMSWKYSKYLSLAFSPEFGKKNEMIFLRKEMFLYLLSMYGTKSLRYMSLFK